MINKEKNVTLQVTFPKEDAEQLETMKVAYHNNGIKCTKSDILVQAFREYVNLIVLASAELKQRKEKAEEPKEETKDA